MMAMVVVNDGNGDCYGNGNDGGNKGVEVMCSK